MRGDHHAVEARPIALRVAHHHALLVATHLAHRRAALTGALPRLLAPLAALGRWSLTFYMVHQPVLIGALLGWMALRR